MLLYIMYFIITDNIFSLNAEENRIEEIEKLKEQKRDLYIKIQNAIDDSVKVLQKSNSSDATVGIKYMEDLKDNFTLEVEKNVNTNGTRRAKRLEIDDKIKTLKESSKGKKFDPNNQEDENHVMVEKKLQDWLMQQQQVKEKINNFKMSRRSFVFSEKCPREGISEEKGNKGSSGGKMGRKYPCCRKCCKRSYMGCL